MKSVVVLVIRDLKTISIMKHYKHKRNLIKIINLQELVDKFFYDSKIYQDYSYMYVTQVRANKVVSSQIKTTGVTKQPVL